MGFEVEFTSMIASSGMMRTRRAKLNIEYVNFIATATRTLSFYSSLQVRKHKILHIGSMFEPRFWPDDSLGKFYGSPVTTTVSKPS